MFARVFEDVRTHGTPALYMCLGTPVPRQKIVLYIYRLNSASLGGAKSGCKKGAWNHEKAFSIENVLVMKTRPHLQGDFYQIFVANLKLLSKKCVCKGVC